MAGNRNIYRKIIILGMIPIMFMFGCKKNEVSVEEVDVITGTEKDFIIEKPVTPEETKPVDEDAALSKPEDINNSFDRSGYILDQLYNTEKTNVMYSPLSLEMALGLLSQGAKEDTLLQINDFLGKDNYPEFARQYIDSHNEYKNEENEVLIANALWINDSMEIKPDFEKASMDNFSATVRNLDFSDSKKSAGIINGWCKDNTRGLIEKIIEESELSKTETHTVITNSVYFKGQWHDALYVSDSEKDFKNDDGSIAKTSYLCGNGDAYYENEYAQAFEYQYMNGYKFVGIIPKTEGAFDVEKLDINSLLNSRNTDVDVEFEMPPISFETENNILKESLIALGVTDIFNAAKCNLSGISDMPLVVDKVIQKCNIILDENGTQAAAVTAMEIRVTSAMPMQRELKTINLDRPYVFLIMDNNSDELLFIGKVGRIA